MYDDRQLLEIELEATYQLDENGRFTDPKATRFFLGQTRSGNVRRFRNDQPDELIKEIDAIIAQEPVVSDLRAGLSHFEEYQRILSADGRSYLAPLMATLSCEDLARPKGTREPDCL